MLNVREQTQSAVRFTLLHNDKNTGHHEIIWNIRMGRTIETCLRFNAGIMTLRDVVARFLKCIVHVEVCVFNANLNKHVYYVNII